MLLGASAPLRAQNLADAGPAVPNNRPSQATAGAAAQAIAEAGPAVPNTPRQVTPQSVAAPPAASPDASQIDASDGKTLDAAPDPSAAADEADAVVVTVNDEPISEFELRQRISLCTATQVCLQPKADDDRKRVRAQILQNLVDEKIQFQEAQKKHITVSPVEIDKVINRIVAENHTTLEQMSKMLSDGGSSIDALRMQFEAQIAWQKAVQDEYAPDINISPADVNAELARAAEGANKAHYLVGEIFLAVDKSDQDAKVLKDAQALYEQLQAGAPFKSVARQFSQSPTAAQDGEIGVVYDGQLDAALNAALAKMKRGDISPPIRSTGGYYILALEDRQEPLGTKIAEAPATVAPGATLKLGRLLLPLAGATKADMEVAAKIAAQIRATYGGCEKLATLPKQLPGAVYFDMSDVKLTDLGPEFQKALATTKPGEMAPPIMDEAGIELIGRCDARVEVRTAFTMPTYEQVQNQLFDQQISALARRYLRDLKRDALVETR